jgi:hypothetical protein
MTATLAPEPARAKSAKRLPPLAPPATALSGVGLQAASPICRRRLWRSQRGRIAVFALTVVLPVFLLLGLGGMEIGRAVAVQHRLSDASRMAARRAAVDGASAAEVNAFVNDFLAKSSIHGAKVSFPQGNPDAASFGAPVEVDVAVPFGQVSWLPAPMYVQGQMLHAATVMRRRAGQHP